MYFFYNIIMASLYNTNYDPQRDSGSSGIEVTDLNPEKIYDTDLRRVDPDLRNDLEVNEKQEKVSKFMKAARTAGKYDGIGRHIVNHSRNVPYLILNSDSCRHEQ